jgi:hypothetical protein
MECDVDFKAILLTFSIYTHALGYLNCPIGLGLVGLMEATTNWQHYFRVCSSDYARMNEQSQLLLSPN